MVYYYALRYCGRVTCSRQKRRRRSSSSSLVLRRREKKCEAGREMREGKRAGEPDIIEQEGTITHNTYINT